MNRRGFLRSVSYSSVAIPVLSSYSFSYAASLVNDNNFKNLPHYLDTLIPEDETPSASQLDIHKTLIEHANNIENYTKLLELGCTWLDEQAQNISASDFIKLSQSDKNEVVAIAEKSPLESIPQIFFERIKNDTFSFYYANPKSWTGIGIDAPIQPLGYLDHTKPPKS